MDTVYQVSLVVLALLLVFLNGFFVASEFAIVKVRETRIQEMVQQGVRRAPSVQLLVRKLDEYLSATQLGITLASLGLGWIGEPAFATIFEEVFSGWGSLTPVLAHSAALTLSFLLITFLHIVLGELAPKSVAIQKPEGTALWAAAPLHLFYKLSYPFIWSLNGTANMLLRFAGMPPATEGEKAHSEEELRLILSHSLEKGVLGREEKRLLERVLDFADRSVRQVMVPSVEVIYLDARQSFEENLAVAREHQHTRYPLCDGSFDRVLGVVHVKEMLWKYHSTSGGSYSLLSIKRPVHFIPESKLIKALLTEFRHTRTHLAVVVDEFGSTIGIVTLEDILEELVGEIEDEFDIDVVPPTIRQTGDKHYVIQGKALLEEVENTLEIRLEDEVNDTIAGHVMMLLGRTARVGDEVTVGQHFRVRVVGMKGLQITDLVFEKVPPR